MYIYIHVYIYDIQNDYRHNLYIVLHSYTLPPFVDQTPSFASFLHWGLPNVYHALGADRPTYQDVPRVWGWQCAARRPSRKWHGSIQSANLPAATGFSAVWWDHPEPPERFHCSSSIRWNGLVQKNREYGWYTLNHPKFIYPLVI